MHGGASQAPGSATYDPARFAPLFAVEDRHFWFRARNRVIAAVLEDVTADLGPALRVLEVGCGTGNTLRVLTAATPGATVVGMDLYREGLEYARQRAACPLVRGDMRAPPFGVRFDLIGLFDVLEHLPDDRQALADLRRMLKVGGALVLTVPAHAWLWSYHDLAAGHRRRYAPGDLRERLNSAGFETEYLTQYMTGMVPLIWLRRAALFLRKDPLPAAAVENLRARELRVPPALNRVMDVLLGPERHLISRRRVLPIGASIIALARCRA
jgi:SAM-dependent methyltransferase